MRSRVLRSVSILAVGLALLLPACVTKTVPVGTAQQQPQDAVVAPTLTIERFLRAVNQRDLDTMARLFGTRDGPITATWGRKEVDDRMVILATLLRHSDYAIGAEQIVPGRRDEATQFRVALTLDERRVQVPFVLVRSRRDPEWLIENVNIECLTRGCTRP